MRMPLFAWFGTFGVSWAFVQAHTLSVTWCTVAQVFETGGSFMLSAIRPTRRQVYRAALVLLASSGLAVALAPAANATCLLPSTTTLSASRSSGTVGDSVTYTAKVSVVVVGGALVTPSGPVAFSYNNGTSSGSLGSATLGSCLLSACTAKLTSTALPVGTNTVTATYGGDGLVAGSSGTTTVTMAAPPPPPATPTSSSASVTCAAGQYCQAAVKTSNGGNTMNVLSSPSTTQQTVKALMETGKNLHCPQNTDNQTGALGTFEVTVNDTSKTVTYTGYGNTARSMRKNYLAHPTHVGCFGSPFQFNGFVGGVYGPAVFVSSDQLYEAQPGVCSLFAPPCVTVTYNATSTTYKLTTPFGDPPKIIG